ncbi:MAG: metallophosphoesterase [Acidobacteriia bacterium]|nr:metallophosphoesterase [Terriglobia bacterium]
MSECFFVSDLHGRRERFGKLFEAIESRRPAAVFLGGDLLPHPMAAPMPGDPAGHDFVRDELAAGFERLRERLHGSYPRVFLILGNDDPRAEEPAVLEAAGRGVFEYAQLRRIRWGDFEVYGYAFVPPTPFQLKDWERYDVSRYVDPGCISPEEGWRTVDVGEREPRVATIREDLDLLAGDADLSRAVFLVHAPPYRTLLDRAALDGRMVDHAPLDVHVGSIALRRFIESRQPLLTLHGHVHESARLTGAWRDRIGRTHAFSAAHDGPELALVRFDPGDLDSASRELL